MNQEHTFSPDDVYEFLKLIVEIGGVHYVDNAHCIRRKSDDTPQGIKLNNGKDGLKLIALYKENMELDSSKVLLNPFTEVLGRFPEKDWFFGFAGVLPGALLKETMKAMANLAVSKETDTGFEAADIISKFIDRIDNKFVTELEKIRGVDIGLIFYSKEKHIAQLNSALWEDDFAEKMKSKLRKSSLMLIRDMISSLLGTERPEDLMYTATLIGCPKFDAVIHVLVDVLNRIADPFEKVTGISIPVKEINAHMQHIEAYHRAMQWLTTTTASQATEDNRKVIAVSEMKEAPWSASANSSTDNVSTLSPTATVATPDAIPSGFKVPTISTVPTMVAPPVVATGMGYHAVMPTFKAPAMMMPGMGTPMMPCMPVVPTYQPASMMGYGAMPMTGCELASMI